MCQNEGERSERSAIGRKECTRKTSCQRRHASCVLEEREDLIRKKKARGLRQLE